MGPKFIKDKNNPNFLYVNFKYDTGGGVLTALGKETMAGQIRRLSSAEAMKQATALAKELEDYFDLEDIDVYDKKNGVVQIFAVSDDFVAVGASGPDNFNDAMKDLLLKEYDVHMPSQEEVDKFFALTQNEMHYLASKPVMGQEGTFNLMPIEPWDEYDYSNWMALVRKAKQQGKAIAENDDKIKDLLQQLDFHTQMDNKGRASIIKDKIEKLRKLSNSGEIDGDEFLDKFKPLQKQLKAIDENEYKPKNESIAQTLAETIKLGEGVIEEELCPKGKAYIKRRKAAGEKSSAYLSGRAVKVCKGQMSGRKKKK